MDEQTILTELAPAINALKTLSLVALDMEDAHPLALPEPPEPDKVAAYERQMTAIAQQVNPRHRALLTGSHPSFGSRTPGRPGQRHARLVLLIRSPEQIQVVSFFLNYSPGKDSRGTSQTPCGPGSL